MVLAGDSCRALETEGLAFEIKEDNIFYLTVSFGSIISKEMKKGYKTDLDDGERCLARIEQKINATVKRFKQNLENIHDNQALLRLYIDNPHLMNKRDSTGSIAIALSLIDLVATSASYFYNDYCLRSLRTKIDEMDEVIQSLRADENTFVNNQEYLFREGKILGIQKNILLNHFNELAKIHSCDVIALGLQNELSAMKTKFTQLNTALLKNELTEDVIDLLSLEQLTMAKQFRNTIYRVSPIHLYSLAKLALHSVSDKDVTFIISYPVISRKPMFKRITLLETSKKLLLPRNRMSKNFKFLMPSDMHLNETAHSLNKICNGDTCFKIRHLIACNPNLKPPSSSINCLKNALLEKRNNFCSSETPFKSLSLDYGKYGVLMETRGDGTVFNSITDEILLDIEDHKCTYLENGQNLAIEQGKSVQEIFPLPLQFQAQNSLVSDSLKYLSQQIQNFSLPELKNPKTYRNITLDHVPSFLHHLKDPFVASTIMATMLAFVVIPIKMYKCCHKGQDQTGGNWNLNI